MSVKGELSEEGGREEEKDEPCEPDERGRRMRMQREEFSIRHSPRLPLPVCTEGTSAVISSLSDTAGNADHCSCFGIFPTLRPPPPPPCAAVLGCGAAAAAAAASVSAGTGTLTLSATVHGGVEERKEGPSRDQRVGPHTAPLERRVRAKRRWR